MNISQGHTRDAYYVVGEGVLLQDDAGRPAVMTVNDFATKEKNIPTFAFRRVGPTWQGDPLSRDLRRKIAEEMTKEGNRRGLSKIPAGYTYLGQFTDHDLSMDPEVAHLDEEDRKPEDLSSHRSPSLDLDSLYGRGLQDAEFYETDSAKFNMGTTIGVGDGDAEPERRDHPGFDLPRVGPQQGTDESKDARRQARIPDRRNDENLIVAQLHLAFMRLHNRVVDSLKDTGTREQIFEAAREKVVKHYQWVLRHDFLPRVVEPAIVDDVFSHGPRYISEGKGPFLMPIEFSVAAYRFGHSMVRGRYEWNRVFNKDAKNPGFRGTLEFLFSFTGTSGTLSPISKVDNETAKKGNTRLPSNWIADFRRLFDFRAAGYPDLEVIDGQFNNAMCINTMLVSPLGKLPFGSFEGKQKPADQIELNLAFRNLTRGRMLQLASGQQMVDDMNPKLPAEMKIAKLGELDVIKGKGGASLDGLSAADQKSLTDHTPLWFYILREAECNGGRLTGVGGRLVAEVFYYAMKASDHSIIKDEKWQPSLLPEKNGPFGMPELLYYAFEGNKDLLNPMLDRIPEPRVLNCNGVGKCDDQKARPGEEFRVLLQDRPTDAKGNPIPEGALVRFEIINGKGTHFRESDGTKTLSTQARTKNDIATAAPMIAGEHSVKDFSIRRTAPASPGSNAAVYKATVL